ncbi:hypothetical protein [Sodalis ligni]|jgi:hypothetical protein|nr:hypothetical protein [Sodalis ligni]
MAVGDASFSLIMAIFIIIIIRIINISKSIHYLKAGVETMKLIDPP